MTVTRRIVSVGAGAALLSAAAVGTAGEAEAAGSPPPASAPQVIAFAEGEFQCGPNNWIGSLVPENPPGGANFHPACVAHDRCYDTGSSVNRKTCDTAFLNRMRAACDAAGKGAVCDGIAYTYYGAVRSAGWAFYKGSGANN